MGHQWDVNGASVGCQWDVNGRSMGQQWDINGMSMGHQWDVNWEPVGQQRGPVQEPPSPRAAAPLSRRPPALRGRDKAAEPRPSPLHPASFPAPFP